MFNSGDVVQVKKEYLKESMNGDRVGIVINKCVENINIVMRGRGEFLFQEETFKIHELELTDEYISTEEFMEMVRTSYITAPNELHDEMFWHKIETQKNVKEQYNCEDTHKIIDRLGIDIKNKIEEATSNPEFKENFEYILGEDWDAELLNTLIVRDCINMIQRRLVMD